MRDIMVIEQVLKLQNSLLDSIMEDENNVD